MTGQSIRHHAHRNLSAASLSTALRLPDSPLAPFRGIRPSGGDRTARLDGLHTSQDAIGSPAAVSPLRGRPSAPHRDHRPKEAESCEALLPLRLRRLRARIRDHPQGLLIADSLAGDPIEGVELTAQTPLAMRDLTRVHDPEYVSAVRTGSPDWLAESQGFG